MSFYHMNDLLSSFQKKNQEQHWYIQNYNRCFGRNSHCCVLIWQLLISRYPYCSFQLKMLLLKTKDAKDNVKKTWYTHNNIFALDTKETCNNFVVVFLLWKKKTNRRKIAMNAAKCSFKVNWSSDYSMMTISSRAKNNAEWRRTDTH